MPFAGLQVSGDVQLTGAPAVQNPVTQVSAPLHRSASAHDVPSTAEANTQPVAGKQTLVVQGLLSSHASGVPVLEQAPLTHVSLPSQRSASAHSVPSLTGGKRQPPVAGLHELVVQGLLSSQLTGVPEPEHTPAVHVSAPSHRSTSAQDVPSGDAAKTQPVAGRQALVVHALPSSQASGVPDVEHTPAVHVSAPSHRSASAHEVPSVTGENTQPPVAGLHELVVHGLPSSQATGVPEAEHTPAVHVS